MKILLVGSFQYEVYEPAFAAALRKIGVEVDEFVIHDWLRGFRGKVQLHLPILVGPDLLRLNKEIRRRVLSTSPDAVLFWKPVWLLPSTVRRLKKESRAVLVTYNNDDPFAPAADVRVPLHHHLMWHWYLKTIPLTDLTLVFRKVNTAEATAAGAKAVGVMMPYYIPEKDRPVVLDEADHEKYRCDVVFVGHYEPDGRDAYIKALVHAGIHVKLFGGRYWTADVLGDTASYFGSVNEAFGDEYAKALCGARICLCFLSKLNRDTYTRRCFEIPATGSLLLSERTDDLKRMFREDEEAVFFSSVQELVEKARWLIDNPEQAARIAQGGWIRVLRDGHSVVDRALEFVKQVEKPASEPRRSLGMVDEIGTESR